MRISIVGRPRSLAVLCALLAAPLIAADDPKPKPKQELEAVANTVQLELQISGLERSGWTLEIKPAHAGSRFETVVREVEMNDGGPVRLDAIAIDARSISADRDCAFAITLKGPDGEAETFKRSIRLRPQEPEQPAPVVSKTYYLRSTAIAQKDEPGQGPL